MTLFGRCLLCLIATKHRWRAAVFTSSVAGCADVVGAKSEELGCGEIRQKGNNSIHQNPTSQSWHVRACNYAFVHFFIKSNKCFPECGAPLESVDMEINRTNEKWLLNECVGVFGYVWLSLWQWLSLFNDTALASSSCCVSACNCDRRVFN